MKTVLSAPRSRWLILGIALLFAFAPLAEAAKQLYTCGMHPQIIREEPGDCPICGMKLTPVRNNGSAQPQSAAIQVDTATVQRMNLKTALVTRGPVRRELRTVGAVAVNEQSYRDITLKYEGWIEKLYADVSGAEIKEGDPLFEVYSPDLYNAELNYLVARRSEGSEGGPLSRAAKLRLQLLDLPEKEIAQLESSGEAPRTRTYRAPSSGIIIEKMVVLGQMMKPGERLYRLADLSTVWIVAQIYESDLAFVREGQSASLRTSYGVAKTFEGKVARLLPQVDDQTRSIAARIVVPNADGSLRPGMFIDVRFVTQLSAAAVLVPEAAVLRSGERNTVFIALEGGTFEPREVTLGNRSENASYEVIKGLVEGERIVTSGQFMLDSESQLRDAIQKMIKGDPKPAAAPAVPTAAAERAQPSGEMLYTCPMEDDADVVSDKPGKCPKCGMKLVPTSKVAHGAKAEELWHKQHAATAPAHLH